jgi:positive regulator of sigma E activity
MFRGRGVVISVDGGRAEVALIKESKAKCGSCDGCAGACRIARATFNVKAPDGLAVGDEVALDVPAPGTAASAILLMLVPLVLFIAAVFASVVLQQRGSLGGGEGMAALIGLGVIVVWYVGLGLYDRHLRTSPEHEVRIVGEGERTGAG